MEHTQSVAENDKVMLRIFSSPLFLVILALVVLFIFPWFLIFLLPVFIILFVKKNLAKRASAGVHHPKRRPDNRIAWLTVTIFLGAIFLLYLSTGSDFTYVLMMVGICTGGIIWAPMASVLLAKLFLIIYDKLTGNTYYTEDISVQPSIAPEPQLAKGLSALSPNEQSLVLYIADASSRGVLSGEIMLILKGNGWAETDIMHGIELARLYYPSVVQG